MRKPGRIILLIVFFLLLAVGLIALFVNAFTAGNKRSETMLFEEEIRDIFISAENADVTVLSSENESTAIELSASSDDFNLSTSLEGTELTVKVSETSSFLNSGLLDTSVLTVHVPLVNSRTLDIQSGNGNLRISEIEPYEVSVYTGNGKIEIHTVSAKYFIADTGNGDISVKESDAQMVKLSSANGNIHLENVYAFNDLLATSSNGSIDLQVSDLIYPIEFKASNGDITIQTDNKPMQGSIEATASNGTIDIFGDDSERITFDGTFPLLKVEAVNGDILVE
ncbi:DUF4097 family beta strand repeat-containing protein [Planococcus sp. SE5232]|uniref:DUF4097 family beta strand repeat-containing protein n=1 Tax=unclassified Planococcus (in: firmicutes) TaxID=2662419 RepID=UPI001CBC52B0|nr:DUF4097 family beta strand repeat-containing protein [Planococcus sp. 4-30]